MPQRHWEKARGSLGQTETKKGERVPPWPCGQYGLMEVSFHLAESLSGALKPFPLMEPGSYCGGRGTLVSVTSTSSFV